MNENSFVGSRPVEYVRDPACFFCGSREFDIRHVEIGWCDGFGGRLMCKTCSQAAYNFLTANTCDRTCN